MPVEDAAATRLVRAQITRRSVDVSRLDVRVIHGVVHLSGSLAPLRDHPEVDISQEIEHITHILRQRPGIRDVVWDLRRH